MYTTRLNVTLSAYRVCFHPIQYTVILYHTPIHLYNSPAGKSGGIQLARRVYWWTHPPGRREMTYVKKISGLQNCMDWSRNIYWGTTRRKTTRQQVAKSGEVWEQWLWHLVDWTGEVEMWSSAASLGGGGAVPRDWAEREQEGGQLCLELFSCSLLPLPAAHVAIGRGIGEGRCLLYLWHWLGVENQIEHKHWTNHLGGLSLFKFPISH